MATIHTSGPATISLTVNSTASNFECQVKTWSLTTDYEEIAEEVQYLGDGCFEPAAEEGSETLTFEMDHDLTATGYNFWAYTNELQIADVEIVPNINMGTVTPASFTGQVVVKRPSVDSGEYGARVSGTVELQSVGRIVPVAAADA